MIMESSLFDSVAVNEQIQNRCFAPTTLTKLAATAIHAAFAMDQPLPSAPPPVFLTVAGASVV